MANGLDSLQTFTQYGDDELYFPPTVGPTAQDTMNMIIALENLKGGKSPSSNGKQKEDVGVLKSLFKLIGGMRNPFAPMGEPARAGETFGQTLNEYRTGNVNPNVVSKHQAEMDSLTQLLRGTGQRGSPVNTILEDYVNNLMSPKETRVPKRSYQP